MRVSSFVLVAMLLAAFGIADAKGVNGYAKKNGTYVAPHQQTALNKTRLDNYSTKGNVNPYTGKAGAKPVVKLAKVH